MSTVCLRTVGTALFAGRIAFVGQERVTNPLERLRGRLQAERFRVRKIFKTVMRDITTLQREMYTVI